MSGHIDFVSAAEIISAYENGRSAEQIARLVSASEKIGLKEARGKVQATLLRNIKQQNTEKDFMQEDKSNE